MTLRSMTGFSRAQGEHDALSFTWEIRAVNGKGLDVRTKLPAGFEALDAAVRAAVGAAIARGNLQVSLTLGPSAETGGRVDNERLSALISEAQNHAVIDVTPGSVAQFMALPGVITTQDGAALNPERQAVILTVLKTALESLRHMQGTEGAALQAVIIDALETIETQTQNASESASAQPAAIKSRLQERMSELLLSDIDPERLEVEAAYLAGKADVREELDRLRAHCEQARALIAQGSPIGRKLGFLAQEFNREANTLCAKSNDIALTRAGLAMKSAIEQFREQAANVE